MFFIVPSVRRLLSDVRVKSVTRLRLAISRERVATSFEVAASSAQALAEVVGRGSTYRANAPFGCERQVFWKSPRERSSSEASLAHMSIASPGPYRHAARPHRRPRTSNPAVLRSLRSAGDDASLRSRVLRRFRNRGDSPRLHSSDAGALTTLTAADRQLGRRSLRVLRRELGTPS